MLTLPTWCLCVVCLMCSICLCALHIDAEALTLYHYRHCCHTLYRYGKPLRVAEMNTISNSGRAGVSDVMAAALWTVDASFEVAQAGGVGVNFHQGSGQNLYAAVIRWWVLRYEARAWG